MSKRTTIEAEIGDITLGNIQIRDGRGGNFLMDVSVDPTNALIDSGHVQDITLHAAMAVIPAGAAFQGGAAVPVAVGGSTVTALAGLGVAVPLTKGLVIQAMIGNAGPIAVGMTNTVNPTVGAEVGAILQPGQSVPMPSADTDNIFCRSTNAADRVTWWGG